MKNLFREYKEGMLRMERELGCFFSVDELGAENAFYQSEFRRCNQQVRSSVDGMVIALKDMILCKGLPVCAGSRILEGYIAPYDATVVSRLKSSGAIIMGKLNQDEFAMGSSGENNPYKVSRNPWGLERVAGGSSSGSAAAVAADIIKGSLGTDTGGSVRQPASFCGIVGFKPSYGRVSRYGIISYASSLDQIGVFSSNVKDVARILENIAGYDEKDLTSINIEVPRYSSMLGREVKGIKVGILLNFLPDELDEETKRFFDIVVLKLKQNHVELVSITIPYIESSISVYYILATAEASSNLARYDGLRYGQIYKTDFNLEQVYKKTRSAFLGEEVKRRILLGNYVLSSKHYDNYYLKAQSIRRKIRDEFEKAFEKVDVIICPTTPTKAYKIGDKLHRPLEMYLGDIFTVPVNLIGLPGISVPIGCKDFPIGLQIIGKYFDEAMVLNLAHWVQEVRKE
ncbi:MAG: Asp-tRNA(Asn)/Glu-tRNA(Gln) amidotransferase subunit GatA [Deltaproteobacteria bacterium]|nr:MAG: Asp-tRNA(Asn)/Glu-tRNA(Gln) amidotransferase subunit GatA [Deltaproteobacteria bacterium]